MGYRRPRVGQLARTGLTSAGVASVPARRAARRRVPARRLAAVGLLGIAGGLVLLDRQASRWGATDAELSRRLPGDELIPTPRGSATRAITIGVPPRAVWPWLVQIGHGRAGMYSYDWLENLFGLDMRSADRIIPEMQRLQVGDAIPMTPPDHPARLVYEVVALDPGRSLVLRTKGDPAERMAAGELDTTWAFVLEPRGDSGTRLLSRTRADWRGGTRGDLANRYLGGPISFLMERKMLLGLRHRAESPPPFP